MAHRRTIRAPGASADFAAAGAAGAGSFDLVEARIIGDSRFSTMPNAFRTATGEIWRAGQQIPLTLPDGSIITEKWAAAPPNARAFFVITAPEPGKNYRLAKMVTAPASPAQGELF